MSCRSRGTHTPKSVPSGAGRMRSVHTMPSATSLTQRTRDGFRAMIRGSAPSCESSLVPAGKSTWVES